MNLKGSSANVASSVSRLKIKDNSYYKINIVKDVEEANAIIKGIEILSNEMPDTLEKPISINYSEILGTNRINNISYQQNLLKPWILPEWITGEQLYCLANTILRQQSLLIKAGYCLIDARPENYWLVVKNGKLIDLAGIKPLTYQNLLSFEIDFQNHFLHPLILEKELNIPISFYLKGNLQATNLNLWGLRRSYTNFNNITQLIKISISNYLSNIISSSSPRFIEFLNSEYNGTIKKTISLKEAQRIIKGKLKVISSLKPDNLARSNWDKYTSFHDSEYHQDKIKNIKDFVLKYKLKTKVVDLGSNLTTRDITDIDIYIDNDMSVCRKMRQLYADNKIILQLNIAEAITNFQDNIKNPINFLGEAKAAIMTGIIHHLIIDYAIKTDIFYKVLSRLFDHIILEFPLPEDPMIKLLIRKKNEPILWDWETEHLPDCINYFEIINQIKLSETRILIELKAKKDVK